MEGGSITGTEAIHGPPGRRNDRALQVGLPVVLLGIAAAGWWWSARMADDMTGGGMAATDGMHAMEGAHMHDPMSFAAFGGAWVAMMAAMMLPATLPVVKLYARAAAQGRAAPVPVFVSGYLALWAVLGVPAYFAWRELEMPLAEGRTWTGVLAGAILLAAAAWQVTPLKNMCLRHCRSPMGFFLRFGGRITHPGGALRMGVAHGAFCVGCCWTLFVVLVALGTMNLAWMVGLAGLIFFEKNARFGEQIAKVAAVAFAALGVFLLLDPSSITHFT